MIEVHVRRMFKKTTFSPSQPWRIFHPPALSLPRQPLRPGTRLIPSKAATSHHLLLYQGVAGMIPTAREILPTQPPLRGSRSPEIRFIQSDGLLIHSTSP